MIANIATRSRRVRTHTTIPSYALQTMAQYTFGYMQDINNVKTGFPQFQISNLYNSLSTYSRPFKYQMVHFPDPTCNFSRPFQDQDLNYKSE
jgi:hypothetical protein